jgi:hypothetical protein
MHNRHSMINDDLQLPLPSRVSLGPRLLSLVKGIVLVHVTEHHSASYQSTSLSSTHHLMGTTKR